MVGWTWSERHIEEYHRLGYTVFEAILPNSLVDDLRRACDAAANGAHVQMRYFSCMRIQKNAMHTKKCFSRCIQKDSFVQL